MNHSDICISHVLVSVSISVPFYTFGLVYTFGNFGNAFQANKLHEK